MKVIDKKITEIFPYLRNPRFNKNAIDKVAQSIKEYGWRVPIVVDEEMVIVAGHTRLEAAKQLRIETVPVHVAEGLTEAQVRGLRIADNKVASFSEFDDELLSQELQDLLDMDFDLGLTGFDPRELDELLNIDVGGLTGEDDVPEPPETPVSKTGDLWILGKHRLLCGDSTKIEDVGRLMDGEKADMGFADPPYNTGMTAESQKGSGGLWKGKNEKGWLSHMFNDKYSDDEWQGFMASFCETYHSRMKDNTGAYICLDWRRNHELIPHIKNSFELSNIIVWDKVVHGLGSDYKYTYELINVCKKGKPEMDTHQGDREYSDVWHIQRAMGKNKDHATAKLVELVERCLRHASKPNSLIIDYFLGSGTTVIACEKLNRACCGMELDPAYIDVTIKRWQDYSGQEATLESTGETYNELSKNQPN